MNAIAQELARRTTPEQLKSIAREKGEKLKGLARQKADEMVSDARQAAKEKVADLRESAVHQAKEKVADLKESAVHQGERLKEGAGRNPALLGGLLGGVLGIGAGMLAKRFSERRQEYWGQPRRTYTPEYGYQPAVIPSEGAGYSEPGIDGPGTGERLKENVSEKLESAKENVSEKLESAKETVSGKFESAKERVGHARENIRQRIPSTGELKERSRHYMETSGEHPWMLAALGIGMGILAARLIPESDLERQKLGDVRHRAAERLGELGKDLEHRVSGDASDSGEEFHSEALTTGAMNEPIETYEPGTSLH